MIALKNELGVDNRSKLSKDLDPNEFLQYYYLSSELVSFCKENGIQLAGGKKIITKRIEHFLRTGEMLEEELQKPIKRKPIDFDNLSLDSIIEENYVCSEKHRTFFKNEIGENFYFCVDFQKYVKNNAGKTYRDAVEAYYKIMENKKHNKNKEIDSQFEYNTYIRDFFKDSNNKGKTIKTAIKCWNYKKMVKGSHKYDKDDLLHIEKD